MGRRPPAGRTATPVREEGRGWRNGYLKMPNMALYRSAGTNVHSSMDPMEDAVHDLDSHLYRVFWQQLSTSFD